MPRTAVTATGRVVVAALLLAAAGCTAPAEPPAEPEPVPVWAVDPEIPDDGRPSAEEAANLAQLGDPAELAPSAPVPDFTPCGRAPAGPDRTHLRPSALTAADRARAGEWAEWIPDGELVVEAATEIDLPDGLLGSGNGYLAALGVPEGGLVPVADAAVAAAPVSLAVLDSPSSGRRVAFLEIRLAPRAPVRWVAEPGLSIGTDGGDGGFVAAPSSPGVLDEAGTGEAVTRSFATFFPDGDDPSTWHQCVVRATGGRVDGVLFSTGWGDGGYPTYLGQDADGVVVSVVSFGGVLPWNLSGLPGDPPPADEVGP